MNICIWGTFLEAVVLVVAAAIIVVDEGLKDLRTTIAVWQANEIIKPKKAAKTKQNHNETRMTNKTNSQGRFNSL